MLFLHEIQRKVQIKLKFQTVCLTSNEIGLPNAEILKNIMFLHRWEDFS